jgi:hypothetical protein
MVEIKTISAPMKGMSITGVYVDDMTVPNDDGNQIACDEADNLTEEKLQEAFRRVEEQMGREDAVSTAAMIKAFEPPRVGHLPRMHDHVADALRYYRSPMHMPLRIEQGAELLLPRKGEVHTAGPIDECARCCMKTMEGIRKSRGIKRPCEHGSYGTTFEFSHGAIDVHRCTLCSRLIHFVCPPASEQELGQVTALYREAEARAEPTQAEVVDHLVGKKLSALRKMGFKDNRALVRHLISREFTDWD